MIENSWTRTSLVPVFDCMDGDEGALSNELVGVLGVLLDESGVLGLTGRGCQGLVPDDVLFLVVVDALQDQVLVISVPDLADDEADFVFEEAGLSLEIFFTQQLAQHANAVLGSDVPHHVHYAVLREERHIITHQQTQITVLLENGLEGLLV